MNEPWTKYVKPCQHNGVEHDCTHQYIEGWDVDSFLSWLETHDREVAVRALWGQTHE